MKKTLIWLIGMPGCGKTTIGRELAAKIGKSFIDSDEYFTGRYDMTPEKCINSLGESDFRSMEARALTELSFMTDAVIACGGGVVELEQNYSTLKNSGIVIYIKRDLESLPIKGRPISAKLGVEQIYEKRHVLYETWCDRSVTNDDIKECVSSLAATL